MKSATVFALDLPDPMAQDADAPYIHVATFGSKKEATDYAKETYGLTDEIAAFFVSEIQA